MIRPIGVCLLACVSAAWGESAVERLLADKMCARIQDYDRSLNGALGVAAIDLTSGRTFAYNADAVFPTASSIKVPILIEMFRAMKRGEFKLTDTVTLEPSEAVGGSGRLQKALANGPQKLTVLDLITAMIEYSDNTATNKCIAMAKMDRVNATIGSFGFHTIRLRRIMMDSAAATRGEENTASPAEMSRLMEMLYRGQLADGDDTRRMIDILKLVKAGMRSVIPDSIPVAAKPGDLAGVECETGIVYLPGRPFVLSVYSTYLNEGKHPVPAITSVVFEYFSKLAASNEYGNRVR